MLASLFRKECLAQYTSSRSPAHRFVKEVSIEFLEFPYEKNIVFVDTPGLNDPVAYFNNPEGTIKRAVVVIFTSGFICICIFAMLSTTQLPYMAKIGISASVGYFGIDRAIEVVQKILSLRK
ncbi:hypothetical protein [Helicobacter ailurogastricus]|uniref:hypothetical protein n=1 Tax=Helicobacter ailurogastricus TaxID=1578720 RepID=UPI001F1ADECA|nr:hypothetical protein [Helicobacter ailurogastricus]GLH58070.1 hypothetical protein NHP214376_08590 [Helicobacter ailurogastricus]GLH59313.1 hypothetical protein NHP214377_05800 [Helicobacter ailurogastricus]GMB89985.1 hypothetical protein NHP190002_06660 [Helicobacter ailurogastricus]